MRNFEAHSEDVKKQMLNTINVDSIDALFDMIPNKCKMQKLDLDNAISEIKAVKVMQKTAKKNNVDYISFLGGGAVKKFIPSAIIDVASRFEFLSAYTPYQPEISQGTLQIMYEFQSFICELTGQDVSNASVYDGATACAESCLMAVRINKTRNIFISNKLDPNYIEVIKTYLWAQDIDFTVAEKAPSDIEFAGKIYSFPNYSGELEKIPEKTGKELIIACVDLSVLPVIEPPDADITVGSYQPFGLPLCFGGAYGGFIAVKDAYKRQLTGRITGKTVDSEGKTTYVLTLQAREQHIRRSKATGNICSNQALTALCATMYMSLIGKNGLIDFANISYKNAHILSDKLDKIGYITVNKEFFNTFTVKMKTGITSLEFIKRLKSKGIQGGIIKNENEVIITVTEFNDDDEICAYISALN